MKPKYLLLLPVLAILACKKDPPTPEKPPVTWGTVSAEKNGVAWVASPTASLHTKFPNLLNIGFLIFDPFGFQTEDCGIVKVPAVPGTYALHETSIQENDSLVGANFFYVDYDLILGYYNVLEADSSSFITISSYDPKTGEVKGSFDILFSVAQRPFPAAPDTLRLRKGVFHTKIL